MEKGKPSDRLTEIARRVASPGPRQAAQVSRVVSKEFQAASAALDALIARLEKTAGTVNPQDHARSALEGSVKSLRGIQTALSAELRELSRVQV